MARQRSSTKALLRRLHAAQQPVYALDGRRRVIFCNTACAAWLRVEPEALFGARCDYHSSPAGEPLTLVAAGLCPPPQVFHGERAQGLVTARRDEQFVHRRAEFIPLRGDGEGFALVLVLVEAADVDGALAPPDAGTPAAELHERLAALRRRLSGSLGRGLGRLGGWERLAGESPAARLARARAAAAASGMHRTVIVGPSGSGRERLARSIHEARVGGGAGLLTPLDGALIDPELLQGAITDFKRRAANLPAQAPATLLLLHADELSAASQDELAGFLALPGFELHTLATARKPLTEAAAAGAFRLDLALGLSTLVIELTPLGGRPGDLPLLTQFLLEEINARGGRQFSGFTEEALDVLAEHSWPGELRELEEAIGHACQQATGPWIAPADLPRTLRLAADAQALPRRREETIELDRFLAQVEEELIRRALERCQGNKAAAARLLGVTRSRLLRRLDPQPQRAAPETDPPVDEEEGNENSQDRR